MFVCNPPLYQATQLFRLLGREQYMLLCLLGAQSKYACNPPLYQAIQFRLMGREQYMLPCLLGD